MADVVWCVRCDGSDTRIRRAPRDYVERGLVEGIQIFATFDEAKAEAVDYLTWEIGYNKNPMVREDCKETLRHIQAITEDDVLEMPDRGMR